VAKKVEAPSVDKNLELPIGKKEKQEPQSNKPEKKQFDSANKPIDNNAKSKQNFYPKLAE
jgi:hypothetical protein